MSFTLSVSAAPPPPGTCWPPTWAQALVQIAAALRVSGFNSLNTFNFGPSTPAVDLQDRPWFKTDSQFNPIGWYSFAGGVWVPIPSAILPRHMMPIWAADASGIIAPWYLCNGQTVTGAGGGLVTPNMQGLAVIGAGTLPASGTVYTPQQQYGEEKHALTSDENGPHTHNCPLQIITQLAHDSDLSLAAIQGTPSVATSSSGLGTAHNNVPPSMAMFWTIYWP